MSELKIFSFSTNAVRTAIAEINRPSRTDAPATVQTAVQWLAEGLPEPWVLFVALMFPHPPFTAEEPWFSLHARGDVTVPEAHDFVGKPRFMRALRDSARDIKNHALANLDFYLEEFERKVIGLGGHVHWAPTAADARRIITELCRSVNARTVAK